MKVIFRYNIHEGDGKTLVPGYINDYTKDAYYYMMEFEDVPGLKGSIISTFRESMLSDDAKSHYVRDFAVEGVQPLSWSMGFWSDKKTEWKSVSEHGEDYFAFPAISGGSRNSYLTEKRDMGQIMRCMLLSSPSLRDNLKCIEVKRGEMLWQASDINVIWRRDSDDEIIGANYDGFGSLYGIDVRNGISALCCQSMSIFQSGKLVCEIKNCFFQIGMDYGPYISSKKTYLLSNTAISGLIPVEGTLVYPCSGKVSFHGSNYVSIDDNTFTYMTKGDLYITDEFEDGSNKRYILEGYFFGFQSTENKPFFPEEDGKDMEKADILWKICAYFGLAPKLVYQSEDISFDTEHLNTSPFDDVYIYDDDDYYLEWDDDTAYNDDEPRLSSGVSNDDSIEEHSESIKHIVLHKRKRFDGCLWVGNLLGTFTEKRWVFSKLEKTECIIPELEAHIHLSLKDEITYKWYCGIDGKEDRLKEYGLLEWNFRPDGVIAKHITLMQEQFGIFNQYSMEEDSKKTKLLFTAEDYKLECCLTAENWSGCTEAAFIESIMKQEHILETEDVDEMIFHFKHSTEDMSLTLHYDYYDEQSSLDAALSHIPYEIEVTEGEKTYNIRSFDFNIVFNQINEENWGLTEFLEKDQVNQQKIDSILALWREYRKRNTSDIKDIICNRINDEHYQIDKNVLECISMELAEWITYERQHEPGEQPPRIPNFVFMGAPGSGKTTLAKKLAKEVFGAACKMVVPAELKGAYHGHTEARVAEKFYQLQEGLPDEKPAVLIIDEAYGLFQKQNGAHDTFSGEIISILLKIMENRDAPIKLSQTLDRREPKPDVYVRTNTVVWLAGYEDEMREAISSNPGIYRRMTNILLPEPTIDDLWDVLIKLINEGKKLEILKKDANINIIKDKEEDIRRFFRWGTTKEHMEFFGGYGGVDKFAHSYKNMLMVLNEDADPSVKQQKLDFVIENQKTEILRQYRALVNSKERLPFEVITELKDCRLENYIGNTALKDQMQEIITMMLDSETYKQRGIRLPKGVLLEGFPGTGKTYLARCMAGELTARVEKQIFLLKNCPKVGFISVSATELQTTDRIKALFATAEEYDYVIIFIDELDAIGLDRRKSGKADLLIQLMNEMDGFDECKNVLVIAATNAPQDLDSALKRPGRFDMQLVVKLPDGKSREDLIKHYVDKKVNFTDDNCKKAATLFAGRTPSYIKEILNEALLLYYRCEEALSDTKTKHEELFFVHRMVANKKGKNKDTYCTIEIDGKYYVKSKNRDVISDYVFLQDIQETIDKKRIGERTSLHDEKGFQVDTNDDGRAATAIHEVGHAVVSVLLNVPISGITSVPRATSLGGSVLGFVSHSDVKLITKQDYLNQIKISLGGRVAEELFYGTDCISYGASDDIQKATFFAKKMIALLGMSEQFGCMALCSRDDDYLSSGMKWTCSNAYMEKVDDAIRDLIAEQYRITRDMLGKHKEEMRKLANYVYDKKEMTGDDFVKLCKRYNILPSNN